MSGITQAVHSLLSRDSFVLQRPGGGVDEDGYPLEAWEALGDRKGTWGSPNARDIETAARMGMQVQAVCAGEFQASVGDRFYGLRGENWIVTHANRLVTHTRYFLRRDDQ